MPYTAPITQVAGTPILSADWNTYVRDNILFLANPPACRVYHSANQSIADGTETTVAFNSERFDTASLHDTATNNSRITFATAGLYIVGFHGHFAGRADYDYTECRLRKNGTTYIGQAPGRTDAGASSFEALLNVSTLYKFAAADYVEVRVYQDNVANAAENLVAATERSPEFYAVWVGLG